MPKNGPKHVVVDGSNLATEGRTAPSLKQLNEAVLSYMNEFPDTKVTVVVDAPLQMQREVQALQQGAGLPQTADLDAMLQKLGTGLFVEIAAWVAFSIYIYGSSIAIGYGQCIAYSVSK